MSNILSRTITLILIAVLLSACQGVGGSPSIQVWLDQPLNGSEYAVNESVPIQAHARDVNGPGIAELRLYIDGVMLQQTPTDPYAPLVNPGITEYVFSKPGTYTIEVKAVNSSGVESAGSSARVVIKGIAVAEVPTRTPTPTQRIVTPTPTPTQRVVTNTPTPTRRPVTPTRTSPPAASTKPIINSVSGPSSIPDDGQTYQFTIRFSDGDGNINRFRSATQNGRWSPLEYDPRSYLSSGNLFNGALSQPFSCNKGTAPFSDVFLFTFYDVSGNASDTYRFPISCVSSAGAETGGSSSSGSRTVTGTFTASVTQLNAPSPVTLSWDTQANGDWKYSLVLERNPIIGQYSETEQVRSVEEHSGSVQETPAVTTTFTLRAFFNDANENPTSKVIGSVTVNIGVTQSAPQGVPTPFLTFTADATTLQSGQCTTLRWTSGNITSIFLDGQGVTGNENRQVCPTQTTVYTLIANAPGGGLQRTVTITVSGSGSGLSFPQQHSGAYVSVSVSGGHGSTHKIGEVILFCFTISNLPDASYAYFTYDYQPASPSSNGATGPRTGLVGSALAVNGTLCWNITINGPTGYEAFQTLLQSPMASVQTDYAEVWIYVTP